MKNLISMEDYVIDIIDKDELLAKVALNEIYNYAKFLNSKPTLPMFVPCTVSSCDTNSNIILKEPEWFYRYMNGATPFMNVDEILLCQDYKRAIIGVIFEGWRINWQSDLKDDFILVNNYNDDVLQFRQWIGYECEFNYKLINTISDLTKFNLKLK